MSNRGLERGLKVRKVILASSIALTITVYLIATIITCIFHSSENSDGTYAEQLFNESCAVLGGKYIDESYLNQTLLGINKNITDNILEVNLTCHQDFINTGDRCEPSCVDTFVHSEIGYLYILGDVLSGLIALSHLLGGSACIVIAIIGRKHVLKFPSILVIYQVITIIISGLLIAVKLITRGSLFCSHPEAIKTMCSPPTTFCTIYGFLGRFLFQGLVSFLLVHMLYILILIKFPIFGKQKLLKKKKTIHIIFVIFGIVTSALGPFVPVAMSNYQVTSFPPQGCGIGSTLVSTYALFLPQMIQLCVATILALVLSFEVYNVTHAQPSVSSDNANQRHTSTGKQEVKLIVLSAFLILISILQLLAPVIYISTPEKNTQAIIEYLQCNLHGDNSTCTIKQESIPIKIVFSGVVTLTEMAIPWVLFFYIVKMDDFKKMKEVCCSKKIIKNGKFCCSKKAVEQSV